jgi:hypothetical protein
MTIDNYEQVKQRLHEGAFERDFKGETTKDIEDAHKEAIAEAEAKALVARYRSNPAAIKIAGEMLSQSDKTQRELELEAEIARLKGEQTGQGLWAS